MLHEPRKVKALLESVDDAEQFVEGSSNRVLPRSRLWCHRPALRMTQNNAVLPRAPATDCLILRAVDRTLIDQSLPSVTRRAEFPRSRQRPDIHGPAINEIQPPVDNIFDAGYPLAAAARPVVVLRNLE